MRRWIPGRKDAGSDLRPLNIALWQEHLKDGKKPKNIRGHGSAAVTIEGYIYDNIRIGEVVG